MDEITIAKIEKLQRRCASLTLAALGTLCLAVFAVAFSFYRGRPNRSVTANEFLLKASDGRILARLGDENGQTCLRFMGQEKLATAELCVSDETGSSILLTTNKGTSRAFISAGSRLTAGSGLMGPTLLITDGDGKHIISGATGQATKLVVGTGSENNSLVFSTGHEKPVITVTNDNGRTVWTTP